MTEERIYTDQWQDDPCPVGLRAAKSSRKIGGYALNSSGGRRISVGTSRLLPQVSPTSRAPTVGLVCCADISTTTRFCLAQPAQAHCSAPLTPPVCSTRWTVRNAETTCWRWWLAATSHIPVSHSRCKSRNGEADELRKLFGRSDRPSSPREPVAIRSLTGATALALTTAKKAKPIPGINAKMLLLGKRHPKKVAV